MADPAFDIIASATGTSPTSSGSTVTFQYPARRAAAHYFSAGLATLGVRANQAVYNEDSFAVSYGPSNITVTLGPLVGAIAPNTPVYLQAALRDMSLEPAVAGYPLPELPSRDGV